MTDERRRVKKITVFKLVKYEGYYRLESGANSPPRIGPGCWGATIAPGPHLQFIKMVHSVYIVHSVCPCTIVMFCL